MLILDSEELLLYTITLVYHKKVHNLKLVNHFKDIICNVKVLEKNNLPL